METTTVNIPMKLLPLWKRIEGLSDNDRTSIFIILNRMSKKGSDKKHTAYTDADYANPSHKFNLSPRVKAAETGKDYGKGMSRDYKKEIGDALAEKYL